MNFLTTRRWAKQRPNNEDSFQPTLLWRPKAPPKAVSKTRKCRRKRQNKQFSGFSSRPWRNLPPPWVGDPQTSPQYADPHGLGAFLRKSIQEIHVDRRVVGWSACRHVDRPCGGQISPWPAKKGHQSTKLNED